MRFRSKPVEIEADQFLPTEGKVPTGVMGANPKAMCGCTLIGDLNSSVPHVHTIHGGSVAVVDGDWIVREPSDASRFYPIKPTDFDRRWERIA